MSIKADIEMEVEPFTVPNFVRRSRRAGEPDQDYSIPIGDLSLETIKQLCDQFTKEIWSKHADAQKRKP